MTVLIAFLLLISAAGWPTDHGDNLRSGYNPAEATYRALSVAFTRRLDGAVYGSPILAGNALIVATENNTVYDLDPGTGAVRWSHHLRAAITDTSVLACSGNIRPTGITGSPAYDPVLQRVFVMTITDSPPVGVHHEIWGLNVADGSEAMNRRIDVPGTDSNAEQQRAALAVADGNVYVAFGGLNGDCGNYKGAIFSLKTSGALGGLVYVVPTAREGAMWAPGGPAVAADGSIYVAAGNGASTSGAYDGSDSVTRLSPTMKRLDIFAPASWASDNAGDRDLGSMTPAMLAAGLILQAGKSGVGYTLQASHLGGVGGQIYTAALCSAYGVSAVTGRTAYLPCSDGLTRVDVGLDGKFTVVWKRGYIPGSPVDGSGTLYALAGGNLYAVSGHSGAILGSVAVGVTSRFSTPALSGSKAYVGTMTGIVAVNVT